MFNRNTIKGLFIAGVSAALLAVPAAANGGTCYEPVRSSGETDQAGGGAVSLGCYYGSTYSEPVPSSGETDASAEQQTVAVDRNPVRLAYVDGRGETDMSAGGPAGMNTSLVVVFGQPIAAGSVVEREYDEVVVKAGETDQAAGMEYVTIRLPRGDTHFAFLRTPGYPAPIG